MNLITAENMAIGYGGAPVLHGVDFRIAGAEIVTVVGPNGSGKSTFLRGLLGMLPLRAGKITQAPGLRVGYVPQRLNIDATMPLTVARFLRLGGASGSHAMLSETLHKVGAEGCEAQQMTALSGGLFQRVLLARALLGAPQILVLDEPTQGLDQPGTAAFYRLISEMRRETGVAILMVSHDLHVVMSASDRVICLNGHICCEGTPKVVSQAPEYRALFGAGTGGAFALYQHAHDHDHDHAHAHAHKEAH